MAKLNRMGLLFNEIRLGRGELFHNGSCNACQHRCHLGDHVTGACRVRSTVDGRLRCIRDYISYARIDPIERKPVFHFMPGSHVYSIGTVGCNFHCEFCQNHAVSIDFEDYPLTHASPAMVVRMARSKGAQGIAFTFNEPTVSIEYVRDVSRLARKKGLYTAFVTNGYLTPEAIDYINPHIDTYIVGIKTFEEGFLRKICGADISKLKESVRYLSKKAENIELSYLVRNADDSFERLLDFYESLERNIPLHLGKFFPEYRFKEAETETSKLVDYRRTAMERGVHYVYISDLYGSDYENTYCPNCGSLIIEREGSMGEPSISLHCAAYQIVKNNLKDKRCPECGERIDIRTSYGKIDR